MPKLAEAIAEMMLPLEPEVSKQAPSHALTATELKRLAGVYRNGASRVKLQAEDGALTDGKKRFTHASEGLLLGEGGDSERLILVPDSNGDIEFIFSGGRAFHRVN